MPDIIKLNSVRNFRDFGGYSGHGNAELVQGKLFRAAHFNETDGEDKTFIAGLDLGLVVDLRHLPERKRQPNTYPSVDDVLTFTMDEAEDGPEFAPHEMFLKEQLNTPEDARQYMLGSYTDRANNPKFVDIFSRTLNHMATTGDPLVIHCAAGKDRTGTLVAIIQKILGMSNDDVMDDFMLTMKAVDVDMFLEPAAQFMTQRFGRDIDPEALRPMFGVEPGYLEAALGAMGPFDDYVAEKLQIGDKAIDQIRSKYLT